MFGEYRHCTTGSVRGTNGKAVRYDRGIPPGLTAMQGLGWYALKILAAELSPVKYQIIPL